GAEGRGRTGKAARRTRRPCRLTAPDRTSIGGYPARIYRIGYPPACLLRERQRAILARHGIVGFEGRHLVDQTLLGQKRGEAIVAAGIVRRRPLGEARQRVEPGTPVELIVEVGMRGEEHLQRLLRMIGKEDRRPFDGGEKALQALVIAVVGMRDVDQLVIGRHAMLLEEESGAGLALDLELSQLE